MPYYCTVPRCTSMAGKAKNVSFHQFPRDLELARLWNDILKRGKPYTKYSKVCSLHFRPEDYTITSVGKNKGQWRTLRKDAVPSQNLPSEMPAPYSRKQWDSWSQNCGTPNVIDPTIQQQMAQAIYMQTMLAMQAAGHSDGTPLHKGPILPELPSPHTSNHDKLKSTDTSSYKLQQSDTTSYKCNECTKCFKDPDVFILHKRTHSKTVEKENFNMNLTLQSNPILANLLKSNSESFEPIMAMENLLMTALAANIDYIRNYSMTKDNDETVNHDRNENFTKNHINSDGNAKHSNDYGSNGNNHGKYDTHEGNDGNQDGSHDSEYNDVRSNSSNSESKHNIRNELQVRNDLIMSKILDPTLSRETIHDGRLNLTNEFINEEDHHKNINSSRNDMNNFGTDINSSRTDMNISRNDINDIGTDMNISRVDMNSSRTDMNISSIDMNCSRVEMNNHRSDMNQPNQIHEEIGFSNQDSISKHATNVNITGRVGLHVRNINYEKDFSKEIKTKRLSFSGNNYTDDENNFHVRSSNDLNESMDSNNLVIDESVEF